MDMTFDQGSWVPAAHAAGHPDWHALRARLHAAYGTQAAADLRTGSGTASENGAAPGSFDPRSALALAGFGASLTAINPVPSEHGNQPEANVTTDASGNEAGRGQAGRGLT
jgi:hypothetical protein